jgi:hypothetical protein
MPSRESRASLRFFQRIPALAALALLVVATLRAEINPVVARKETAARIAAIRAQLADLDLQIRLPDMRAQDFAVLQDLRTSLDRERVLLEERERVYDRMAKPAPVVKVSSVSVGASAVTASSAPAKSLWEAGGWARFEGVLPCAGCDGVKTEITLYSDGLKYETNEKYLGENAPNRVFTTDGQWTTLRGWGKDEDATVFELDFDRPGHSRHFLRLNDDLIKLVDLDESQLKRKPNLLLKRVAP